MISCSGWCQVVKRSVNCQSSYPHSLPPTSLNSTPQDMTSSKLLHNARCFGCMRDFLWQNFRDHAKTHFTGTCFFYPSPFHILITSKTIIIRVWIYQSAPFSFRLSFELLLCASTIHGHTHFCDCCITLSFTCYESSLPVSFSSHGHASLPMISCLWFALYFVCPFIWHEEINLDCCTIF